MKTKITIDPEDLPYSASYHIGEYLLRIVFYWNSKEEFLTVSIYDGNLDPILIEGKAIVGEDLFSPIDYDDRVSNLELVPTMTDTNKELTEKTIGTDFYLEVRSGEAV